MDLDLAEQIVYVYLMRILGAFGILGNVVILSVLLRKTLNESSYVYLTAMTAFDICVNVLAIAIGFIRCNQCEVNLEAKYFGGLFEVFVFLPLINMAATASLWTVLAMAIERYVFVAHPITGKAFCRRRTARMVIVVICVTSALLNAPRFFLYQVSDGYSYSQSGSMFSATNTNSSSFLHHGPCEKWLERVTYVDGSWNRKTNLPDNTKDVVKLRVFCFDTNTTLKVTFYRENQTVSRLGGPMANGSNNYFEECCGLVGQRWPLNDSRDSFLTFPRRISLDGRVLFYYGEPTTTTSNLRSFSIGVVEMPYNATTQPEQRHILKEESVIGNTKSENYFAVVCSFEAVSFMALVFFNLRLVLLLRRHSHKRRVIVTSFRNKTFNANQVRDEIRLSVTLIAIIVSAVFTNASTLLASEPVGHLIYGTSYKQNQVYRVFVLIANLAVLCSSSFNFLIYAIFNSRFKQEFKKVYCQKSLTVNFFKFLIYYICCCKRPKRDSWERTTRMGTKSTTTSI